MTVLRLFFFLLVHFQISLWWTAMKVYKKKSICQCKLSSSVVGGLITLPLALVGSYFLLFDFMYVLVNIHKTVTVQTVQTWHVWVVNCRVGLLSVSGDGWTLVSQIPPDGPSMGLTVYEWAFCYCRHTQDYVQVRAGCREKIDLPF